MLCWAGTGVVTQQGGGHGNRTSAVRWGAADSGDCRCRCGDKWACGGGGREVVLCRSLCQSGWGTTVHGRRLRGAHRLSRIPDRAHPFPHHGLPSERSDVCVTDDTHSTPLAIPHTTHHIITPLHSIAGLSLPHAHDVSLAAFDGGGGGRFAFVAVVAVVERGSRWQRQK